MNRPEALRIELDNLSRDDVQRLVAEHLFAPARRLYARHGFVPCPPFADYRLDPNSVYLTLAL